MDLQSLLIPTLGRAPREIEQDALCCYTERYCNNCDYSTLVTHDEQQVAFYKNRFDHAFYGRKDWTRSAKKDTPDVNRLCRIRWVEPLVGGEIPRSECWLIPDDENPRRTRRLYTIHDECFLVWLEQWSPEEWWFSSAYIALRQQIRAYCKNGTRIWKRD